ncbi:hypothetical protein JIX56_42970 [Streptomyces sp. CA-210063]|uniref:hypothetical protein n=1 Tax=Streptomyces sp. CA-210063 TaxID=2801029 RepID=UPI00214CC255|nr:hypothetical protein [Streptomyces sp. CA-210063]UUU37449.1 hypothetical protein JIX56_42970 [Streptomyces sp. CA-210063]
MWCRRGRPSDQSTAQLSNASAAAARAGGARVVSHVLDWEQLPDALPQKHLEPVFVRADG